MNFLQSGRAYWRKNGSFDGFFSSDQKKQRSQDYPLRHRLNGATYVFDVGALLENKGIFYGPDVFAFPMSKIDSIDIDDEEDFFIADALLSAKALDVDRRNI